MPVRNWMPSRSPSDHFLRYDFAATAKEDTVKFITWTVSLGLILLALPGARAAG